jgi:hypothetical protein
MEINDVDSVIKAFFLADFAAYAADRAVLFCNFTVIL